MKKSDKSESLLKQIEEQELQISGLKSSLERADELARGEGEKRMYYQLISDFTFGWELWFEPRGNIKYCSPSCYDLTGYTANQILHSKGIEELLVYGPDQSNYRDFLNGSLRQLHVNQVLEFRIMTRTKQLRWCMMYVRGVYDKKGKYMGIRASVQDVTRLKNAMGHISTIEKEKEFEVRTKQRLQNELDLKDRELVSFLLQLSQKNELISKTLHLLEEIVRKPESACKQLVDVIAILKGGNLHHLDWGMVENQIEKLHPGFLTSLKSRHPVITENDKRLCAYIRLGLSSKEISGLLHISPKSVEVARVRLRKKIQLPPRKNLIQYLSQL